MFNPFDSLMNGDTLWAYPNELINGIQGWQEANHAKFASSKIFREEFYKYLNTAMLAKYNFDMDRLRQRMQKDFSNELEKIAQQNKDNYYVIQDLSRAVAKLTEELQAQKPAPLKSKKKK